MNELPADFIGHIVDLHGEEGRDWLDNLPGLIVSIEEQWRIRVGEPIHTLTYNYVAPVAQEDGSPAILKLGFPGAHIEFEADCLRRYDGRGAPYLLEHDAPMGAMLLERVQPGTDITQLEESEAMEAAVTVMQQLHQASISGAALPTVRDWWNGFHRLRTRYHGSAGPLPDRLVDEAESLYAELAGSMEDPVLLHADLHHGNILAGDRLPWFAIDPQGLIGEPAYEVGAFLRNPMPDMLSWSGLDSILERRVAMFSERLGIDRRRLAGWGYSQAVLSGIWALEDHGAGWESSIQVARVLGALASP